MAETTPPDKVIMRDFGGMASNQDPEDLPPGTARVQVNVRADRPGQLRPRRGWVRIRFDD